MRNRWFASACIPAFVAALAADVHACGSKYHVPNFGARARQIYTALRPANILICRAPVLTELATAPVDPAIQETLLAAGHDVTIAETSDTLTSALRSDDVDIVLVDLEDAPNVERLLTAERCTAIVLPVMQNPTSAAYEAAEAIYDVVLQMPAHSGEYLETIDEALRLAE